MPVKQAEVSGIRGDKHCLRRYAREKFAARHGLSGEEELPELAEKLPHTRAWLALLSGRLPALLPALAPAADLSRFGGLGEGAAPGIPQVRILSVAALAATFSSSLPDTPVY